MNRTGRTLSLPPGLAARINPVCDRFEDQLLAGASPRLEEFLPLVGEADRPALLRELLALEIEYRARRGEVPAAEEYRGRLPNHAAVITAAFATGGGSRERGPAMSILTCPGCGQKLRVADGAAGRKAKCPRCAKVLSVPAAVGAPSPPNPAAPAPVRSGGLPGPLQPSLAGSIEETRAEAPRFAERSAGSSEFPFLAPPEGPNELGRLGGYSVLKKLGAGGMGVVFRGHDSRLNRAVALKAMLPAVAEGRAAHERFLLEARATAALTHDHIVRIYQVGEDRGVPFLAMEFLEGETLDDCLKRERRLPISDVLRIGREIAAGLAAAHAQGLLHRDIKPGNVWLEAGTRRVKILDFGLARSLGGDGHLTQVGGVVGTPLYMAPEQAQGAAVDQRCDLFSVACVLYRMCTGQLPFKGATTMAILRAVAMDQPTPPVHLSPDVPAALSDLILKLLAKDRADRPGSAVEVIRAIADIERGGAVTPTSPAAAGLPPVVSIRSTPEPSAPTSAFMPGAAPGARVWRRRRLVWIAAGAGLALFVAVPVVLMVLFSGSAPPGPRQSDPQASAQNKNGNRPGAAAIGDGTHPPLAVVPPEPPGPELVRRFLGHSGPVAKVDFAPDGKSFYSFAIAEIQPDHWVELWLWAVDKDREVRRCNIPRGVFFYAMALSPDRDRALVGGSDLLLWDLQDDRQITSQALPADANELTRAPDKHKVLISNNASAATHLWDLDDSKELFPIEGNHGFFSPDGRQVVTAKSSRLMVWDAEKGQEIHHFEPTGIGPISQLASFGDGQRLVLGTANGNVEIWDYQKGERLQVLTGHTGAINALAVSADGRRVLTGGSDSTVRWWNAEGGEELHSFKGHIGKVNTVAISPGGRRALSGGEDQTIRMWSLPE